jgi:tetratricopeptide (TPR) repeat protein/glycosyltransferase involved in cell wall biosynthesis
MLITDLEALQYFKQQISGEKGVNFNLTIRALGLCKAKYWDEAEKLYTKILQNNPYHEEALYGLALLNLDKNEFSTAENILNLLLEKHQNYFKAWFSLGNINIYKTSFLAAINCYEKSIKIASECLPILNNLGYAYQKKGDLEQAIICYKKALQIQPDSLEIQVNIINTVNEQSILSLEKQREYGLKNYELGNQKEKQNNPVLAQLYYQQALKLNPNLLPAHYCLGKVYQAQNKLTQAQECYQKVISIKPNSGEAYYSLATLYQDQGNLTQAALTYKKALTLINPYYAEAIKKAENEATNPPLIPILAEGEVKVGDYFFPGIPQTNEPPEKRPFFSVVIPAYQRRTYILECLASVLAQWLGEDEMEILVMDNGSEPPLQELVDSIGKGIVNYYRHPQTVKLQENWNSAIASSRGQWIHVLNDDDYILPNFYQQIKQNLTTVNNSVGAVFTDFNIIDEQRKITAIQSFKSTKYQLGYKLGVVSNWFWKIGKNGMVISSCLLIHRRAYEKLGGYSLDIISTTDWELYKRVACFYDWYYVPDLCVYNRQHEGNVTSELTKAGLQGKDVRLAIEYSHSYLPIECRDKITESARDNYFNWCLQKLKYPLASNNILGALQLLQEAIKINNSPAALDKLFHWLNTEEASVLRAEIALQLTKINLQQPPP